MTSSSLQFTLRGYRKESEGVREKRKGTSWRRECTSEGKRKSDLRGETMADVEAAFKKQQRRCITTVCAKGNGGISRQNNPRSSHPTNENTVTGAISARRAVRLM